MFIGEAPGRTEDQKRDADGRGTPFHGDSGQEFNEVYLPLAGLRRSQVYVTNTVQCIPAESGGNPNASLAECCSRHHLPGEMAMVQPDIIVTLGAVALHTLFPAAPGLDKCHGIPFEAGYAGIWSGTVFPMYHPAAGLRSGDTMGSLVTDFASLGKFLADGSRPEGEPGMYVDLDTPGDVDASFRDSPYDPEHRAIAMDTETYDLISLRPYCLSYSTQPGMGFVIHHENQPAIDRLYHHLSRGRRLLMHNAPFDLPILETLFHRELPPLQITDTMIMAYNLCSVPRGLKQFALRYLGVEMTGFEELVKPWWHKAILDWATLILPLASSLPSPTTVQKRTITKLRRLVHKLENPETQSDSFDPWKLWITDWHPWDRDLIAAMASTHSGSGDGGAEILSPSMPPMSISQAPWHEVVPYAGADADMTLRSWPVLKQMSRRTWRQK